MPFVRISVSTGLGTDRCQAIGDVVHEAMVEIIGIPAADRFQLIDVHSDARRLYDRHYLGIERSNDCVFVEITLRHRRTPEMKRALYKTIASRMQSRLGLRQQDIMIVLRENELIDWSFGDGEAQLSPR